MKLRVPRGVDRGRVAAWRKHHHFVIEIYRLTLFFNTLKKKKIQVLFFFTIDFIQAVREDEICIGPRLNSFWQVKLKVKA